VPDTDEGDEGWYLFNDSLVQRSAYASFSAISSKFSSDVPYVLFYARRQAADLSDGQKEKSVYPAIAREVEADNARFLGEQEAAARQAARLKQNRYAYACSDLPFYDRFDDDDDNWGGRGCGEKRFDDFSGGGGGGGGFGGPRFVS